MIHHILRYFGIALLAAVFGVFGGSMAANKAKDNTPAPKSEIVTAVPAQPFPGQGIPAIPAVPAQPRINFQTENKITVLNPNGGENFCDPGDPVQDPDHDWVNTITWSGNTDRGVKIALLKPEASQDKDPTPYIIGWVFAGQTASGLVGNTYYWGCGWNVYNDTFTQAVKFTGGKYKILVAADDGKGNFTLWNKNGNKAEAKYDMSDQPFTIRSGPPKVRVISPTPMNGETRKIGDVVIVRFETSNVPDLEGSDERIEGWYSVAYIWLLKPEEFTLFGQGRLIGMVPIKAGTGTYSYNWQTGNPSYPPGDYYIDVTSFGGFSGPGVPADNSKLFHLIAP